MNKKDLEWYVLNGDINHREVKMWNIFNNWLLRDAVKEHIKEYKKGNLTYEQFKEEVRKDIMWQEWARCEYEIYVSYWEDMDNVQKIDCYYQAVANLEPLCQYLIHR